MKCAQRNLRQPMTAYMHTVLAMLECIDQLATRNGKGLDEKGRQIMRGKQ